MPEAATERLIESLGESEQIADENDRARSLGAQAVAAGTESTNRLTNRWVVEYGDLDHEIGPDEMVSFVNRTGPILSDPFSQMQGSVEERQRAILLAGSVIGVSLISRAMTNLDFSVDPRSVLSNPTALAGLAAANNTPSNAARLLEARLFQTAVMGGSHASLESAVQGVTGMTRNHLEGGARWLHNKGFNVASMEIAEDANLEKMWVPERDACVACQAYAGDHLDADSSFEPGKTYGNRPIPLFGDSLDSPPLHPNCRCRLVPYNPEGYTGITPSEALKREAERSILKGWSVESEPESARLQAAAHLLATTRLPKSVRREAEANILRESIKSRVP